MNNHNEISAQIENIQAQLLTGDISIGQALAYMRKHLLELNQTQFSKMCGISVKTLSMLENDDANITMKTLDKAFKIFGMKAGLVPKQQSTEHYMKLLDKKTKANVY